MIILNKCRPILISSWLAKKYTTSPLTLSICSFVKFLANLFISPLVTKPFLSLSYNLKAISALLTLSGEGGSWGIPLEIGCYLKFFLLSIMLACSMAWSVSSSGHPQPQRQYWCWHKTVRTQPSPGLQTGPCLYRRRHLSPLQESMRYRWPQEKSLSVFLLWMDILDRI